MIKAFIPNLLVRLSLISSKFFFLLAVRTKSYPFSANKVAKSFPSPEEAPVMSTVLFIKILC